jgi:hypothetical protein
VRACLKRGQDREQMRSEKGKKVGIILKNINENTNFEFYPDSISY